jgi:Predicted hydrolases or acyltransferases (alpha/beta hydrolase superfamily)
MSYADVNGISLYYEEHGSGQPLILLHGGYATSETYAAILPSLASGRRVIAVDLQGHGRTADVDRPLSFQTMGDDIAALIRHLGLPQADVMGYSFGAGTALRTAIQHPSLVRRLVIVSHPVRHDGWFPQSLAGFDQMGPAFAEAMKQSPIYEAYARVAPRVEDWPVLVDKMGTLLRQDYDWSAEVAEDHRAGDAGLRGRRLGVARAHRRVLRAARRRAARRELGRLGPARGAAGHPARPHALRHLLLPRPAHAVIPFLEAPSLDPPAPMGQ